MASTASAQRGAMGAGQRARVGAGSHRANATDLGGWR